LGVKLSFVLFTIFSIGNQAVFSDSAGTDAPEDPHYYHFVTRPDLGAPKWTIQVYDEEAIAAMPTLKQTDSNI
jgi:hypothetical protein